MQFKISARLQVAAAALGLGLGLGACAAPDGSAVQSLSGIGCTINAPDPRACDPADTKKTTICHLPPGNPANAHTLCVGNAAVPAHLDHGDFVGTCACPGGGADAGLGGGGEPDAASGGGSGAADASIVVP